MLVERESSMNINKNQLVSYINKLNEPKILVIGDLALDEMIYGDTERISREAPVLILQHTNTKLILGGASNAAHNVSALNGGKTSVIGVCGDDFQCGQMEEAFEKANVNYEYLIKDSSRKTTTKTRISGSISTSITQQIVRIDRQTNEFITPETEAKVIANIEKAVPEHDAIILSNYHVGTLTKKIIDKTIELANKYNKIIVVDAQRDLGSYKNITSITPNLPDTEKSVGFFIENEDDLKKAGNKLLEETNAKAILITCGADGMFLCRAGVKPVSGRKSDTNRAEHYDGAVAIEAGAERAEQSLIAQARNNTTYTKIPVFNKSEVFDVTGAGDTVTAVYTLALAAGADPVNAAIIGNIAASIVVRYFGCATTTIQDLLKAAQNL